MKLFQLSRTKLTNENPVGVTIHAPSYPSWNQNSTGLSDDERLDQILKEFAFVGEESLPIPNPAHRGIELLGPVDGVRVSNGSIYHCDYGIIGVLGKKSLRESRFDSVFIRQCRVGIHLEQPDISGDGINNVTFRDCHVVYPHESAVILHSEHKTEYMRRIFFTGGLYHSRRSGLVRKPLFVITGNIRRVVIDAEIIGGDQTPTILIQGNKSGFPKDIRISGCLYECTIWCCETSAKTLDISSAMFRAGSSLKIVPDFSADSGTGEH